MTYDPVDANDDGIVESDVDNESVKTGETNTESINIDEPTTGDSVDLLKISNWAYLYAKRLPDLNNNGDTAVVIDERFVDYGLLQVVANEGGGGQDNGAWLLHVSTATISHNEVSTQSRGGLPNISFINEPGEGILIENLENEALTNISVFGFVGNVV